jgi:hypothetical protein
LHGFATTTTTYYSNIFYLHFKHFYTDRPAMRTDNIPASVSRDYWPSGNISRGSPVPSANGRRRLAITWLISGNVLKTLWTNCFFKWPFAEGCADPLGTFPKLHKISSHWLEGTGYTLEMLPVDIE